MVRLAAISACPIVWPPKIRGKLGITGVRPKYTTNMMIHNIRFGIQFGSISFRFNICSITDVSSFTSVNADIEAQAARFARILRGFVQKNDGGLSVFSWLSSSFSLPSRLIRLYLLFFHFDRFLLPPLFGVNSDFDEHGWSCRLLQVINYEYSKLRKDFGKYPTFSDANDVFAGNDPSIRSAGPASDDARQWVESVVRAAMTQHAAASLQCYVRVPVSIRHHDILVCP